MYAKNSARPFVVTLHVGSLDKPEKVEVNAHIWLKQKLSWVEIPDGEQALTAELRDFVLRSIGQRTGPTLNGGDVGLEGMKRVEMALYATGFESQLIEDDD